MRLWHQRLLGKLPRHQILAQHSQCCALRGNGWNRKHSTVNYVFDHSYEALVAYHQLVIDEMERRNYNPNDNWKDYNYRGKNHELSEDTSVDKVESLLEKSDNNNIYPEHDDEYYKKCISILKDKEVKINSEI